jgi:hypothetical protein
MRAPERQNEFHEFHCESCRGSFNSCHELNEHRCPCETSDHIALQLTRNQRGRFQVVERRLQPFAILLSFLRYSQESRKAATIL